MEITITKDDGRFFAEVWQDGNAEMSDYTTVLYEHSKDAVDDAEQWVDAHC